jgi:hypothetical protein
MAPKSSFWRRFRVVFRWCRITLLLAILILVSAFYWVNQIGLPDFVKSRILQTVRTHGIELGFTRIRWRVVRGIVADNVSLRGVQSEISPHFSVAEIELKVDHHALLHRRLQVNELILHDGEMKWALSPTNVLVLNHIECHLNFQTNDTWALDRFTADFAATKLSLAGKVVHAPELQNWPLFQAQPSEHREPLQARIKKISDIFNQIDLTGSPRFDLTINGDARDIDSFNLRLALNAAGAQSPWGQVRRAAFSADIASRETEGLPPSLTLRLAIGSAKTPWANVTAGTLSIQTVATITNRLPPVQMEIQAAAADTRWGDAKNIHLNLGAQSAPPEDVARDAALGPWTNATPFALEWAASSSRVNARQLSVRNLTLNGSWHYPFLALTNIVGDFGNGHLAAGISVDAASRRVSFTNNSNFDLHTVIPLLTEKTRSRLEMVNWTHPPVLVADGSLILPAWTNRQPDWHAEVQPTIRLHGRFAFTNSTFMKVPLDLVNSEFDYSNLVWSLPNLQVAQANTRLLIASDEDESSKIYHAHISGVFDPQAIRPFLLTSNAIRGFSRLSFHEPLGLDVNVTGNLYENRDLMAAGSLAITNVALREQHVETIATRFLYTNRTLTFFQPELWREKHSQTLRADTIFWDMPGEKLFFTNGFSTTEPIVVGRAIGPKTAKSMEPYQFLTNPVVRVNGCVPLRQENGDLVTDDADMHFEMLQPAPFRWRKFQTPRMFGAVLWRADSLILTNVTVQTYGGESQGWAVFDLHTKQAGTDFRFFIAGTNVDIHRLGVEVLSPTNRLEGLLSGTLKVSRANSEDWRQWFGYGNVQLHDGLIWDIPMFGILSPVLNSVTPGLGSSRATDASASFIMTNGVIATDSMIIHSTMTRLQYVGTVDLQERLNARVTAQLLRGTPVFGNLFSTLLWPVSKLFEYEVTGTLKDPKTAPYHDLSRLILMPLHPVRTLEELIPGDNSSSTNAPPKK